jgi:hypothetical protein
MITNMNGIKYEMEFYVIIRYILHPDSLVEIYNDAKLVT